MGKTVTSSSPTSPPSSIINAKTFGAVGDGITDDTAALQAAINAAFVVLGPHDPVSKAAGNQELYIPAGIYKITEPLKLNGTSGAIMRGAGRFTTQIVNATGSNVFTTNGCQYSKFSDMLLQASGSGVCFDLDWDGISFCSAQSNEFNNIFFAGGAYGLRIGNSGFMGSENVTLDCFFEGQTIAGLSTKNFNALQNTVVGGNFQNCAIGIWVNVGSVPSIVSVGFQGSGTFDIKVDNSANDCVSIIGCRTESPNFAKVVAANAFISACNQISATHGTFAAVDVAFAEILGCTSIAGQLALTEGGDVRGCQFGRNDWFSANSYFRFNAIEVGKTLLGSGDGTPKYLDYGVVGLTGAVIDYLNPGVGVLADQATINTDASIGLYNGTGATVFSVTLNGNRMLANPTHLTPGMTYSWVITQGSGGNYMLALGSMFKVAGGPMQLSTSPGAVDILSGIFDGIIIWAQLTKTYA